MCGGASRTNLRIDTEKTSSGWNPAFNLYLYILPYFHQNKMIKLLGSLLQRIGQSRYMNFIEIVIFHFLVFSIIVLLVILMILSIPCTL